MYYNRKEDDTLDILDEGLTIATNAKSLDFKGSWVNATAVQKDVTANISGDGGIAANISYDNSTSGLVADDVQAAIDEIDAELDTIVNPLLFKGSIALASDFPTPAAVQIGWFYKITADVTDNDGSKTNTGQSFLTGDEIAWNWTNWTEMGSTDLFKRVGTVLSPINSGDSLQVDTITEQTTDNGVSIEWVTMENGAITLADYIQLDTTFTDWISEGRIQWNIEDGTPECGMPGGNVNLQIGQEMLIRVKNEESITIPNGTVVYASSSSGNVKYVKIASNDDAIEMNRIVGVTTEAIAADHFGYITVNGLVRDMNTDWFTWGQAVYLGTNGWLSATPPTAPNKKVIVGIVVKPHATEGILYVRLKTLSGLSEATDVNITNITDTNLLTWNTTTSRWENSSAFTDANEFTGIPPSERAKFTLSYNYATQVLTLTKISNWFYYYKGKKVNVTWNIVATAHTNAYGTYYYYFNDASGTLTVADTIFDIPTTVQVAYVIYNPTATDTIKGICFEERHGLQMDGMTHEYLHEKNGSVYESGGAIADYTPNVDSVAATTYSITATTFDDEDLETTTIAQADGSNYTLMWRTAAWQWDWLTGQSLPYIIANNNLTYNPSGSALVEITTTNRWVNFYPIVTNAVDTKFQNIILPSRALYTSLALAQAEEFTTYFSRSGFLAEFVPLYKVTYKYNTGYSKTTGKSRIESVQTLRGLVTITGAMPATDHLSLSNLTGGTYSDWGHTNLTQQAISASSSPTVNEDIDGYKEGSHWVKQDDNSIYHCADNADGAAVWYWLNQSLLTTSSPTFAGLSLGSGNLSMTGSIASTGSRVTKWWFTDLEVTNAIAGSITGNAATVTIADEASDTTCFPLFATAASGSLAPKTNTGLTFNSSTWQLQSTIVSAATWFVPDANDWAYLGTSALQFSDLFLAEWGVINWDNGDCTLTQTGNSLVLAGADLTVPWFKTALRTITDSDTSALSDYTIVCNKTTAMTVTLHAANTCTGQILNIKNINTGLVTVDANSTETIDWDLTQTLVQWENLTIQSNGTNWIIL